MAFSIDAKSFHVYLSSDGCLDRFPNNKPSDFRIVLKNAKELNNKNKTWKVGLARLGYDSSALYNLGENTSTFLTVFVKGKYFSIDMKNVFAPDAETAVNVINEAIQSAGRQEGIAVEEHVALALSKDKKGVVVTLKNVGDFGMSPMLRKLLGFHQNKKIFSENFEFRKMCREFLSEVAEVDNFSDEAKRNEIIKTFDRTKFKSLKVAQRNEAMKAFKLDIETMFFQFNWSIVPKLQQMISKRETEFKDFVNNFYYPNHRPDFKFTMNESEIVLPFSMVSTFNL